MFKLKLNYDGTIVKHKARLVACGFIQNFQLFLLSAKIFTLCLLLSLIASHNWNLPQHDINNAFITDIIGHCYIWLSHDMLHCRKIKSICLWSSLWTYGWCHVLLRYLKHIKATSNSNLHAYVDIDLGSCLDSRRSTTDFCIFLGNSLISRKVKRQKTVRNFSARS